MKTECQIASTKAKVNQYMHYHSAKITLINNMQENLFNFTKLQGGGGGGAVARTPDPELTLSFAWHC